MIEQTKQVVEEKYTIANGYAHNAQVISDEHIHFFSVNYNLKII